MHPKKAVLLVNIGTPTDPQPKAVGAYLKEFLMDPLVIDIPWIFRFFLVHFLIVPKRATTSSQLYQNIWTQEGSPLAVISKKYEEKLQALLGSEYLVLTGMRYGQPSLEEALKKAQKEKCEELVVFPLYPQYSQAAHLSSEIKIQKIMDQIKFNPRVFKTIPFFYQHPEFIQAYQKLFEKNVDLKKYDHILFSYHGLPERQLKKTTPEAASYCFQKLECCEKKCEANRLCYRAHCFETTRLLSEAFQLPLSQTSTCFQSRLGRTPWIQPYTDVLYETLPKKGIKKIAVLAPSFIVDCLETLEEIQIRGKEQFFQNGGEVFDMIPCLNASAEWVNASKKIIQEAFLESSQKQ